jgi:FecR protein
MANLGLSKLRGSFRVRLGVVWVAVLVLVASAGVATAQATGGAVGRAVRLSVVDGQAKVIQDGEVIADPATANMPIFEGSAIETGLDGRVEIQFEDGSTVRVTPNSQVTLAGLTQQGDARKTAVVVNSGLVYVEAQAQSGESRFQVSYGMATVEPRAYSVLRVNMDSQPGEVAVFSGNVEVTRGSSVDVEVHGGENLTMDAGGTYNVAETISNDSWDAWNADRDQELASQQADKTVATDALVNTEAATGARDLDSYGNWFNVPGVGMVWSPFEAIGAGAGWDPYGFGRWVYYPRFGYVFVSGYPWGYTPYSCGAWNFYDGFGWGWMMGSSCDPWWGNYGGGGWVYNIRTYPMGYQPPHRPFPRPTPGHGAGEHVVAVNNPILIDRRVEARNLPGSGFRQTQPLMLAGRPVEPIRPIASRPSYSRGPAVWNNHLPATGAGGMTTPANGGRPSLLGQSGGGARPAPQNRGSFGGGSFGGGSNSRPASSGGGGASHPSSGGGGGGGGSHPSSSGSHH